MERENVVLVFEAWEVKRKEMSFLKLGMKLATLTPEKMADEFLETLETVKGEKL